MKFLGSIHARAGDGRALVLLAFLAVAGLAVQRAHADSVLAARFAPSAKHDLPADRAR